MQAASGLVFAALLGLCGCASLSEKDCRGGDWYAIGLRDGAAGRTENYIGEHSTACQRFGVAPDHERWLEGRERGLKQFCTVRNGYRIGEVGGRYDDVCFAAAELEFRRGYELGLRMNQVRSRLERIENEIRVIELQLARKAEEITEAERERLRWRLRELEYERSHVRSDHDDLERRGRSL